MLWAGANLLSAVLALGATRFYVFVYTLWLKRTSTPEHRDRRRRRCRAGARRLGRRAELAGWTPIVLFVAMFLWTPPHFWALAIKYADDYRAADVPMLPAVVPIEVAVRQMIGYTVALVVTHAAC